MGKKPVVKGTIPHPDVAIRLRAIMAEFGYEYNWMMAEACGANESAVNPWVNGDHLPRVNEMLTLSKKAGVSLEWIYAGNTNESNPKEVKLNQRIANGDIKTKRQRGASRPLRQSAAGRRATSK